MPVYEFNHVSVHVNLINIDIRKNLINIDICKMATSVASHREGVWRRAEGMLCIGGFYAGWPD